MFVLELELPSYVFTNFRASSRCFDDIRANGVEIYVDMRTCRMKVRAQTEEIGRKSLETMKNHLYFVDLNHALEVLKFEEMYTYKRHIVVQTQCFPAIFGEFGCNIKQIQYDTNTVARVDKRGSIAVYGSSEENVEQAVRRLQSVCPGDTNHSHDISPMITKETSREFRNLFNRQSDQINAICSPKSSTVEEEGGKSSTAVAKHSAQDVRCIGNLDSTSTSPSKKIKERTYVDHKSLAYFIGSGGVNVKWWESEFSVEVQARKSDVNVFTGKVPVDVIGSSRVSVKRCLESISKWMNKLSPPKSPPKILPKHCRQFIIDSRDENLFNSAACYRFQNEFKIELKILKRKEDSIYGLLPVLVSGESDDIITHAWDNISNMIKENESIRANTKVDQFQSVLTMSFAGVSAITSGDLQSGNFDPVVGQGVAEETAKAVT